MTSLQEIKNFIGDKSILIIASGEKTTEVEAGVVVRMNYGIQDPCDIWVDGMMYLPKWYNKKRNILPPTLPKHIVRLDWYARNMEELPGYLQPKDDFKEACKALDMERPSTGMQTLYWFKKHFPDNEKIITGYNGSVDRYTKDLVFRADVAHDKAKERQQLQEWIGDEIFRAV